MMSFLFSLLFVSITHSKFVSVIVLSSEAEARCLAYGEDDASRRAVFLFGGVVVEFFFLSSISSPASFKLFSPKSHHAIKRDHTASYAPCPCARKHERSDCERLA